METTSFLGDSAMENEIAWSVVIISDGSSAQNQIFGYQGSAEKWV